MPITPVYDMSGAAAGEIELPDGIFGIEPNEAALHAVVRNQLANRRRGTQSTLTRAEVRGGGIKPWRQKGTGRARQGSIRSPQWTHGGIALGPKPRDYSYTLNKKLRRLAMKSALSAKFAGGAIKVIDDIGFDAVKTKDMVKFLGAIDVSKAYVIMKDGDRNVVLSARNIPGVTTAQANLINVYDILRHDSVVIDRAAVAIIEEVFA